MKKDIIKILISAFFCILSVVVKFNMQWINIALFIISYLFVGLDVIKQAIINIKHVKIFDENFLMVIATIGAFVIGEYPEAVAVMLFYKIGELFEDYATDKSRKSISDLMDIKPDYANVLRNEKCEKVNPNDVKIGEIIIVKPGEKVPLDGLVIEGETLVDTKALTGESVPRKIKTQEKILSGVINLNGLIKIKVEKEYGESTVSKILDLIENASSKKSKSENFITKFAKVYTPIVVILAIIIALVPSIFIKDVEYMTWIYRALSFLVVSCPCALVISIPLSFFAGIGAASKIGVLIKGGNYLEALANTEIMVFDKTGTLTEGVFEVQEIKTNEFPEEELLALAAYSENYSNHPIGISIKKSYGKNIDETKMNEVKEISGEGLIAKIEEKTVLVGNEKLMTENNIQFIKPKNIGTVVHIAFPEKYLGYILISDKIKEESGKLIEQLKRENIKKIVMLTGDKKEIGESVAKILKIDTIYTELLPDEKVKKVEELLKQKSKKGKLIFVGDGINDSPVLAMSDIGIAMGGLGTDAAIEASDVVLMTDELKNIPKAIKISKKTLRIVKENIIFAIGIKILVLILTGIGISTMWEAVFADVGVTAISILNAIRALKINKK